MSEEKDLIHFLPAGTQFGCFDDDGALIAVGYLQPGSISWNRGPIPGSILSQAKPILRRMEDMTEDEENEYKKIMEASAIARKSIDNGHWKQTQAEYFKIINGFEITWLQERGFDYLGLIPSGQAVDVKTLTDKL